MNDLALSLRNDIARIRYALSEVKLERMLRQLARAAGRNLPTVRQWPNGCDGLLEIPSLVSLKWSVSALQFQLALWRGAYREGKAGYDPNQPRVPRGEPGGGQWTDAGGSSGDSKPADTPEGDRAPLRITIHPRPKDEESAGDGGSVSEIPRLSDPPTVPEQEPETARALNQFAKEAAYWLARAALREAANPAIGTFINVLEAVYWGYKTYPYIKTYLDPPKTLDELQRAVSNRAKGYDIHHIVEQTPAENDGYPRRMVNAPENLVRIPTLKHWQITGWYMTRNDAFGGLSPREYLQNKDWSERLQVGRNALILHGVLKP